MKLSGITRVVASTEQARQFYEDVLGFEPDAYYAPTCWQSYITQAGVFYAVGQAPGSTNEVSFAVADIEALWARVKDRAEVVSPLERTPWGTFRFVVRDPDGHLLAFGSEQARDLQGSVRRYFERLLNERDVSVCAEMLAADYVDHDAPPDTPPGPASVMAYVRGFLDDYPDLQVAVEDVIAEGKQAAARLVWRGHHRATGEEYHKTGVVMIRFDAEGKMAERWSGYKTLV